MSELLRQLVDALNGAAFLENEGFEQRQDQAERAFASAPFPRSGTHAGGGYPADPSELTETLRGYLTGAGGRQARPVQAQCGGLPRLT